MSTETTEARPDAWALFMAKDARTQVERIVRAMTDAVEEQGADFTYRERGHSVPACQYVRHDMPSCLVGVVLHKLGLSLDMLRTCDDKPDSRIAKLWPALGLSRDAGAVLAVAQSAQDAGETWGSALAQAMAVQDAFYLHED